jgi:hypothetical protein
MLLAAVLLTAVVPVSAQDVTSSEKTYAQAFPDESFRKEIFSLFYSGVRGNASPLTESDKAELASVEELFLEEREIADLTGIEYFTGLGALYCEGNQLTSLDLSANRVLKLLNCDNNLLTELDLSRCADLTELRCVDNKLTELDVSKSSNLILLDCRQNRLTGLDLSSNAAIADLICYENNILSVDDITGWRNYWEAPTSGDTDHNIFWFEPQNTSGSAEPNATPTPIRTPTPAMPGGVITPTPRISPTGTPTPTHIVTITPTPRISPTSTPTPTHIVTITPTPPHISPTSTPTPTHIVTITPTPPHISPTPLLNEITPTPRPSGTPSPTPRVSLTGTPSPTPRVSLTGTPTPLPPVSPASALPIEIKLNTPADVDLPAGRYATYAFTAPTSGVYRIFTEAYGGGSTPINDTVLYLYANFTPPDMLANQIGYNDDYNSTRFSQINYAMTTGTTYYIKLKHYNSSESLHVRLTVSPPSGAPSPTPAPSPIPSSVPTLKLDEPIDVNLPRGQAAVYAFTVEQAGNYRIFTGAYQGGGLLNDTVLYLYSNSTLASQLAFNDDYGGTRFSEIRYNILSAGTYFIKLKNYSSIVDLRTRLTATPLVIITPSPTPTPLPPESLTAGKPQDIDLPAGQFAVYAFTSETAGRYKISTEAYGGGAEPLNDTVLYLYLNSDLTNQVAFNDDYGGTRFSEIQYNMTANRTYYIKLKHYSTSVGLRARLSAAQS